MTTITKETLIGSIPSTWKLILQGEFTKPYWDTIVARINNDECHIYPPVQDIFNALKNINPDDVKVILLGQDPYPGAGMAHGYSFSVSSRAHYLPPSLKNIFAEIGNEYKIPFYPIEGDLRAWERDGVLLLNTILTVRPGESLSHKGIGWENFTGAIIKYFASKDNVLFLLLGAKAREAVKPFQIDASRIISAGHPSPLNKTGTFKDSGCFLKVNEELMKRGILPIRWPLL